jgi:hypothetical protein
MIEKKDEEVSGMMRWGGVGCHMMMT